MVAVFLLFVLLQADACPEAALPHIARAAARGEAFDLAGATDEYVNAARAGCVDAEIAAQYLRGLQAAREAYKQGGSPESLAAVRAGIAALESLGAGLPGDAQIARAVLQAAAAAAQSERDEMSLLLEYAVRLEGVQRAAGLAGLPIVTAHEVAGDLWLQVHGYDEARQAYRRAAERVGNTPRVMLGLARVAVRQKDSEAACGYYRSLLAWWAARPGDPPEVVEARQACASPQR